MESIQQYIIQENANGSEIIPNNESTTTADITSRFSGADWYEQIQKIPVILLGVGGIGSYVAFLLSRLNVGSILALDPDNVELGNLSGQLYSKRYIGNSKVFAMNSIVVEFSNYFNFVPKNEFYTTEKRLILPHDYSFIRDITNQNYKIPAVICGFDNMEARKVAFTSWMNELKIISKNAPERLKEAIFIDGRLAAEEFQIFCITGDNQKAMQVYVDNFLFSDDEAEVTRCSYKQTSYCATMIGSMMVNLFVNFVTNMLDPIIERGMPFFTYYNAETMLLNQKY